MPAELPELLVPDSAALRDWMVENHRTSPGVRLVLTKKGGTITTLTIDDAVDEGLCFGWIDSQAGRRDDESWTVRFTPRRKKSVWSKKNVERVERLEAEGRMTEAGRAEVEAARADGRWEAAYDGPANATVPDDLAEAIATDPEAQAMFGVLTSQNRFAMIGRLASIKRQETRERVISEYVEMLARHETPYPQKRKP
ncbi:MAG TPA: YdeI/OmpD-associated family protein [Acidimicrobiia bacterium]|nr:YdeI/OmpD-associated family protein [Acidimicrobiia bacterium]